MHLWCSSLIQRFLSFRRELFSFLFCIYFIQLNLFFMSFFLSCLLQKAKIRSKIVSTIEQQFIGFRWDTIASGASWAAGARKWEWYVRNLETDTCLLLFGGLGWLELKLKLSLPWTHMQFIQKRNKERKNGFHNGKCHKYGPPPNPTQVLNSDCGQFFLNCTHIQHKTPSEPYLTNFKHARKYSPRSRIKCVVFRQSWFLLHSIV